MAPTVDYVQQLLALWRLGQVLVPIRSHKDIVFDAHATHVVEGLQDVRIDEGAVYGAAEIVALDILATEVAMGAGQAEREGSARQPQSWPKTTPRPVSTKRGRTGRGWARGILTFLVQRS